MTKPENFPFLTPSEFKQACRILQQELSGSDSLEQAKQKCVLRSERDDVFLVIEREVALDVSRLMQEDEDEEDLMCDEQDDETLTPPASSSSTATVEYHILLSPTYQLPVLYFNLFPCSNSSIPAPLEKVYETLVRHHIEQVKSFGIIGAISQGDHPVLGNPWFFVHPCNTAASLREWEVVDVERYLRVWMGIVGAVVGLFLPVNMEREMEGGRVNSMES